MVGHHVLLWAALGTGWQLLNLASELGWGTRPSWMMLLLRCGEQVTEPIQACSGIRGTCYKATGTPLNPRIGMLLGAQE